MYQTKQHQNQCPENRNVMAIQVLAALGFKHVNILKALPKLSGLKHADAARQIGVTRQAVTHTLNCARSNRHLQSGVAKFYGVPVEIMFPDDEKTTQAA